MELRVESAVEPGKLAASNLQFSDLLICRFSFFSSAGTIEDMPVYDFDGQFEKFAFTFLSTREEAINAISRVRSECNKVAAMSLFHVPMTKAVRLEEFEQLQSQATSQVLFSIIYLMNLIDVCLCTIYPPKYILSTICARLHLSI